MMIQAPKGTRDVLPEESFIWQYLENKFHNICKLYGYQEVRFPTFEATELFERGVGDTTDIVQKEMYTFNDKAGRSITLRPEGTASVARIFIEHGFNSRPMPQKLCYNISAFRYENPQGGRYREFHQFGIENFGSKNPITDAEVISFAYNFFKNLGLSDIKININSIGCPNCRKDYHNNLKTYFSNYKDKLCKTCLTRLEKNPLRILDCKEESCKVITKDAPKPIDNLCDECKTHHDSLCNYLSEINIPFSIDPWIVRGLDYYTKTVFEVIDVVEGRELAICGGGRYDNLINEIGGMDVPGIGFALGIERLISLLKNKNLVPEKPTVPEVFVISMGERAKIYSLKVANLLRSNNISTTIEELGRSIKAQMKYANKLGCSLVLIIGENEIDTGKFNIKNMKNSEEYQVDETNLLMKIKELIFK
ncbi:histidine--tRNA ligase [Caldicellulosiruptoraceae bacterium PP1]